MNRYLIAVLFGLVPALLALPNERASIPQFIDITPTSGIKFRHLSGDANLKNYIFEAKGGGAGFLDYDNDGWMDILLVQGSTLERFKQGSNPGPVLYRNKRDGTFEEVTARSGLKGGRGWGMGVAVADYDNDGYSDLYVTNHGPNVLYRNNGDGTFTDVSEKAGVGDTRWGTSAAFGDYDGDGYLDLYVCNYLDMNFNQLPAPGSGKFCFYLGKPTICGPKGIPGAPDVLYRNNGNGTFTDVSEKAGVAEKKPLPGLGVIWADMDNDHDLDLYVVNDAEPNYLYLNRGDGAFDEKGMISGLALSGDGREQASMGVDAADYDNDGLMDVFATHFASDYSTLYHNEGNLVWEDVTLKAQLRKSYGVLVGWGTRLADFDNDGWKDIYHSNGHVYPFLKNTESREKYEQPGTFFLNQKNGKFEDVSDRAGNGIQAAKSSRGVAFADVDNDGDVDLLISNMDDAPQLLRNDQAESHHWLMFKMNGKKSNRDGIGARITVVTGTMEQIWEIKRTVGIYSSSDPRAHFGLGRAEKADIVKVLWPGGKTQEFKGVAGNQHYVIDEERGLQKERFAGK